jgi:aryl-alcohol dehydrogenase-like predicted oxidoreductase
MTNTKTNMTLAHQVSSSNWVANWSVHTMNYRRLGSTGMRVSEIGLGGWVTFGGQLSEEESIPIIHKAFDLGINFFDCADVYADGRSEEIMGKALEAFPREEVVLASKVRGRIFKGPNGEGLSRKHIVEACHASLRRLKVDYIDLYQAHWWDTETPIEESMEAFDDLVRQGKVLYTGCSNFTVDQLTSALAAANARSLSRFASAQPCYNMLARQVEQDLFPLLSAEGMGAVIYCPLAQGLLSGKYKKGRAPAAGTRLAQMAAMAERLLNERNLGLVARLDKIASRIGKPLAQIALAWVLRRPEVSSAITGVTSLEQLRTNVRASTLKLKQKDLAEIERALSAQPA